MSKNSVINLGILAHVDAGKTTLTENFLYACNAIKTRGNVDRGNSVSDSMEVERKRGISIKNSCLSAVYKDTVINFIDTPGHADFSAEVERVLVALNGVVMVVSAVEGVQAHTHALWNVIRELNLPCIFFINKLDRDGADAERVILELISELQLSPAPIFGPTDWNDQAGNFKYVSPGHLMYERFVESLADHDDNLMEKFIEGDEIHQDELQDTLQIQSKNAKVYPVVCGIAKNNIATTELLETIIHCMPAAERYIELPQAGYVFKIEHRKDTGVVCWVRLFAGQLKIRDEVFSADGKSNGKVLQLFKRYGDKIETLNVLEAGDVAMMNGLHSLKAGDWLGDIPENMPKPKIQQSVFTVTVVPANMAELAQLAEALTILALEDPSLNFKWIKDDNEMHLNLMGEIQIEVLKFIMLERFGLETEFQEPEVIYMETPLNIAESTVKYTMPKPCWAVMKFRVEPLAPGSGVMFESKVSVNDIHRKYQNEVENTIGPALVQGIQGWEVTDIKITLLGGEDHEIHSRPGDFILATPMGVMRALENSGTALLEPVFRLTIVAAEPHLGIISSEITTRRGRFESPEFDGSQFLLSGILPVAESKGFNIRMNSITGGKAKLNLFYGGYEPCPEGHGKSRPYKGVSPLNQSQWILHQRGAFKADDRKM